MSEDTEQRIKNLEAEIIIARQRVTYLVNENRHLRECHPNMRDQFAMAAITAVMGKVGRFYPKIHAVDAYEIADAMMEARDAKND